MANPSPILLWAVDPFEYDEKIVDSVISALGPLASRLNASVQPVYVLTPTQISLATEFTEITESLPAHTHKPAVEHFLDTLLEKQRDAIPSLSRSVVVAVESTSVQVAAQALTSYADSIDASMIVVSSHGRGGLGRFLLGSFAEALMTHAHQPVVVARPGTRVNGFQKMLFATDLTDEGHDYFLEAVEHARRLGMEMQILHCVSYTVEPFLQSGVYLLSGGWMPIDGPLSEEIESLQKTLEGWVEEARKKGLKAGGAIYSHGGGIGQTILRVAGQDGVNLIVMAVQSGRIASALLGSISREVTRHSQCPVMLLRRSAWQSDQAKKKPAA